MTYDASAGTDRDYLRFLIHDTSNDAATEAFSDDELDMVLTRAGGPYKGAATACRALAADKARRARLFEFFDADVRVDQKETPTYFLKLAKDFDEQAEQMESGSVQVVLNDGLREWLDMVTGTDVYDAYEAEGTEDVQAS